MIFNLMRELIFMTCSYFEFFDENEVVVNYNLQEVMLCKEWLSKALHVISLSLSLSL